MSKLSSVAAADAEDATVAELVADDDDVGPDAEDTTVAVLVAEGWGEYNRNT